ncbi:MAG: superoxide dismutase family protein [Lawsonibacter sp.]
MGLNFGRPMAVARIRGEHPSSGPSGTVSFYPSGCNTFVVADIHRLPHSDAPCSSKIFGFHIHEGTSCAGADFSETKGHYNPDDCAHPYHAGDLPPLFECNGHAFLVVLTNRFCISDIIGRTVVIHSQQDDFTSQPSGNSGAKIACGVICPT